MQNGDKVTFHCLKDTQLQCPFCRESFSRLVSHATSNKCNISKLNIDIKEFSSQLNSFKEGFRLEMGRRRKQTSRMKLRDEKGIDLIKKEQNEHKLRSRANLREEKGIDVIKKEQNEHKQRSLANLREVKGVEVIRKEQTQHKLRSQANLREEKGIEVIKKEQNQRKQKSLANLKK
jgi:hypothetical protein